ncbi:MAG: FAD-binding oxidoreductase [Methylobacter sp.]|nr:FAD-binding oxidoreductase [Methylobacter sp.]
MSLSFQAALSQWKQIIGSEFVVTDFVQLKKATANCIGVNLTVPAILYPNSVEAIVQIVLIANECHIPLYPYSTGRNWGYGSANPVKNDCVLIDLSRMNKIVDFDAETGLISVQPGVTQRVLNDYLKQHHYSFLIPVTGAGPDCSLLGNALERGYGITPYTDHFAAVMGLQAVLPDGEIYNQSMLSGLGGNAVDRALKWGIGPYIDGLFSQSNFGIVTQMTIALAPKPQCFKAFFFSVKKDDNLELAVEKIRQVLIEVGSSTGSINLMNKHRVLSMSEPYPKDQLNEQGLISDAALQAMARRNQAMDWTGIGAVYGNKRLVAAVCREIKSILRPVASRLVFLTPGLVNNVHNCLRYIPVVRDLHITNVLNTLNKTMQLFAGEPSEIALPLAYWRSGSIPQDGTPMNPAQDGCGLIWYSPLVPMKPHAVREYVEMAKSICLKYHIEPLITLTSLSYRCFDSTISILFDRQDEREVANARDCYNELFETGRKKGFVPYRLGVQSMNELVRVQAVPDVLKKIKKALDPNNIIAPGRYGL